MIGFFTDPYPDELLYSACARYHRRVRYRGTETTARDLFGHGQTTIVVDLPTRLNYLTSQLPAETYSVNRLIDEYTMMPLYTPFMPPERCEMLRQDMSGEGGGALYGRLGVLTSGIDVKYLRFCVLCVEDDRRLYRKPYWHRIHQAPGVEVCPTHSVFLSDSCVSVRNRSKGQAFITAKDATSELMSAGVELRPLDSKDKAHNALLKVARDAAWILSNRIEVPDQTVLRRRYLRLLLDRKLASPSGFMVRHDRLKTQFLEYYSAELLQRLGCGLELRYHWLRRLLNAWERSRHPLHHLLLMQFLDCSAEEFFRLPVEDDEPYGKGPWPCLNVVCPHYREVRIAECRIGRTQGKTKRPIGTFQCECGFTYRRIGPDMADERRFEYDSVMSFGEHWYAKLREMLAAREHTRREMACMLSVSFGTINIEIKRLKEARESGRPLVQRFLNRSAPLSDDSVLRGKHRKQWRELRAENPNAGRAKLSVLAKEAYRWLLKHDRKWLDDNHPRYPRRGGHSPRVDWPKRDQEYSAAVHETAANMRSIVGRPVRVSRTGVAKKLKILTVVDKSSAKLPQTNSALDEVAESLTSFAIRRVRWATDCFRQERVPAGLWKLQMRAGISNEMMADLKVKAACEDSVRALRELNEAGWEGSAKGSG